MAKVLVRAIPAAGYRKLGRLWEAKETEAEVSAEEFATLKASPHLIVVEMPDGGRLVSHEEKSEEETPPKGKRRSG